MEGFTEVGLGSQHLVSILMLHVFATIIIGDRAEKGLRVAAEFTGEGTSQALRGLGREFGQVEEPTGSLQGYR